jgi:hypothetical protein
MKYKTVGDLIKTRGVNCKILIAKDDPIVPNEISINLANCYGFEYLLINPDIQNRSIHDFADSKLTAELVSNVEQNFIKDKGEFKIAPELGMNRITEIE